MRIAYVLAVTALLCTGCIVIDGAYGVLTAESGAEALFLGLTRAEAHDDALEYALLIETEGLELAMYEPADGCYLGAAAWRDVRAGGDMAAFEKLTGVSHAILAVRMKLGGELPEEEMLQAVASKQAILLTVDVPDGANPYDEALLAKTAQELGRYSVPLFVDFFPYEAKMGFSAESYRRFFARAWQAFNEYAPSAAMVWSVSLWDAAKCLKYYPGDAYVEWVGVFITADIDRAGQYPGFAELFADFCAYFQESKPIMVTSLSLSHFTTSNNTYHTDYAARTLTQFYTESASRQPRVKAVVYQSYNAVPEGPSVAARNNYLLTDEDTIIAAYAAIAADPIFLTRVAQTGDKSARRYLRAGHAALYSDGRVFIPENYLAERSPACLPALKNMAALFGGETYYPADAVCAASGGSLVCDDINAVVYWLVK